MRIATVELESIEDAIWQLCAIERLKTLKCAYFRTLDAKEWDAFAALLTEDCTYAVYRTPDDPEPKRKAGRDAIVASIRRAVGTALTFHQGFVPEITLHARDRASAIWGMSDYAEIGGEPRRILHGAGRYYEDYMLGEDGWQIARLELRRAWITLA